jgi:hypothetical protein
MARLEYKHKARKDLNRLQGVYNVVWQENNVIEEPRDPLERLQEELNQFIGEPNTEITRAAIQSLLFRYNFLYGEHLTIEDLNIF